MSEKACCPNCGSLDVAVASIVMGCHDCDWSHLNKYPCDVCKQPSVSKHSCNGNKMNRCKQHAPTVVERDEFFKRFINCHLKPQST